MYGQAKAEASSHAKAAQEQSKAHAQDVATADSPDQVIDEKKQGVMEKMRQLRVSQVSLSVQHVFNLCLLRTM